MSDVATKAPLSLQRHNPDVLTCIANLSNDEVFTPPDFANRMLDTLADAWADANHGANIWADPKVTFLDPFTKSGVFLREIVSRLTDGLEKWMPDLESRVDHILTKQVFGIGITQLTALLARRSVYCSKWADGTHSIAKSFDRDWGNIWFERTEHTWVGGHFSDKLGADGQQVLIGRRCKYCGASEEEYARESGLESHAYAFIHTDDIKARLAELFGAHMQFDVIIGNPPYQLGDGGFGTSAAPIYQLFVEQAKALDPRFLTMVIPARWFAGGKGLDEFRESMLEDGRLRAINDYLSASDVFPGVGLKGGICYFLWDRDNPGLCQVTTHYKDQSPSTAVRNLLEPGVDVFLRFNEGVSILRKVVLAETGQSESLVLPESKRFERLVSSRKPFGLDTAFKGTATPGTDDDVLVYRNGGTGFIARSAIPVGQGLVDTWKVYASYAAPGTGNRDTYPHRIISTPFLGEPHTISSETYLCIGPFDSKGAAVSALSYLACRLTRFLILLHKPSQHVTRKVYTFVPSQHWSHAWTDEALYEKYQLTRAEVDFIESLVRPLEIADA